jgi:RNA polymerase sigma-54 factor
LRRLAKMVLREETVNLRFSFNNSQVQSLAISAQMIQSIKLLQYNREELQEFINEQVERNPLIEFSGFGKSPASSGRIRPESASAQKPQQEGSERFGQGGASVASRSTDSRERGPKSFQDRSGRGGSQSGGDYRNLESFVAARVSLRDHLRRQLGMAFRDAVDRVIAIEIIESLDDNGYLSREVGMLADAIGASEARIEMVLAKVQKMDPVGVAARNLKECLELQMKDKSRLTPPMEALLGNLPLLAKSDYRRLAAVCGVQVDEILAMAKEIKDLDPRPGRRFDFDPPIPALPDVVVNLMQDGTFVTELNTSLLPRVLVNRQYYSEVRAKCAGTEEVRFVTDCLKSASWLVKNLDQRAQTILKVATEIVTRQRAFLISGVEHLRPLNLKDIADAVGIHQSTVSRAISNRYIMTSRGMFELKFFFANSIAANDGGEDLSSDTVRHKIKQMIASEEPESTLSDDVIMNELRRSGIDIARRTVAKYREGMNISSSLQRRRQKTAETMGVTDTLQKQLYAS